MVVCLPEKMIRKCFGGNEKEWRKKKSNLKKKVLSAFFRHYGSERRSVCGQVYVFLESKRKKGNL